MSNSALNIVKNALKVEMERQRREIQERKWKEYTSNDDSMTVYYEVIDQSYTDEFGLVKKYAIDIKKVVADVTDDENYTGLAEDLRIQIEAELESE